MESKYLKVKELLEKYNQEHVLNFYNELSETEKENLLNQILDIDFELMNKLYKEKDIIKTKQGKIEPIGYIDEDKIINEEKEKYQNMGESIVKKGKYGIVIMAGGQGTRLGHSGPKGTYMLNTTPPKSIFEIHIEKLKQIREKYNITVPIYIMTSNENNDDTIKFFEKNNYFDYPKDNITFFKQGELPMIDQQGKLILEEKGLIKKAADGNGGIFEAMFKNNVIQDMKNRGIEWILIGFIDNILVNWSDLLMIGITQEKNMLVSSKTLMKSKPEERVGVFYKLNGKPSVIEYTEITDEMANLRDSEGQLMYGQLHIGVNMFNIKAIEMIGEDKLSYHTAFKKCNYIDEKGGNVISETPNAYKFEAFIFDAFERLDDILILKVKREESFAPVKNAQGEDSPQTAIELYNNYYGK